RGSSWSFRRWRPWPWQRWGRSPAGANGGPKLPRAAACRRAPSIWLSLTTALVVERSGPDASVNSRKADRWPLHIGLIPACGPEELLRFASVAGYTRRSISHGMGLRCSDLAKLRVMAPSQDPSAEPTAER